MLEPQAKTQQLYLLLCTHSCKGLCHRINFGLTVITAVTLSESVKAAFQQSAPQCKYDIGDIYANHANSSCFFSVSFTSQ